MEQKTQTFPTETVDLPSKGVLYPKDSPLSSGQVEMKYMGAKEEDILTNQNYIQKGVVINKLLQALIVNKDIKYEDLLIGDVNVLLVGARILGYGKDYEFTYNGEKVTVDLSQVDNKPLHPVVESAKENLFTYTLPTTKNVITFKLLTNADDLEIEKEVGNLKRINRDSSAELSTRMKHMIKSVDGKTDPGIIRSFVDNSLLARDARAFRAYVKEIQPDVNMKFYPENGPEGGVDIPVGVSFFWPDAGV